MEVDQHLERAGCQLACAPLAVEEADWAAEEAASAELLAVATSDARIPPTMAHVVSRSPRPETVVHSASSKSPR